MKIYFFLKDQNIIINIIFSYKFRKLSIENDYFFYKIEQRHDRNERNEKKPKVFSLYFFATYFHFESFLKKRKIRNASGDLYNRLRDSRDVLNPI